MRFSPKFLYLIAPVLLAGSVAAYLWWTEEPPVCLLPAIPIPPTPVQTEVSPAAESPVEAPPMPPIPPVTAPSGPRFAQGSSYQAPPIPKRLPKVTTITAADVERDFAAAKTPGERAALAETIAAQRDPETFTILSRLYARESVASVREALIAGLAEIDEEEHTPAKITLLGSVLQKEPRNIRRAALEVLAQLDAPDALALLKKAAKDDPDFQIREAAKAFLADQ